MNARVKKLWIKELRDTKNPWVQGSGMLMSKRDEACCLGVLCDIAVRDGAVEPWVQGDIHRDGTSEWGIRDTDGTIRHGYLPDNVRDWARLRQANPIIPSLSSGSGTVDSLGMANDVLKLPFPEIADLIEKHL